MKMICEPAKETAKKIRKALKDAFPGIKFSVRSEVFSMGDSVNVWWTDGPLSKDVNEVIHRFKSGSFDGMQDMYQSTGYEWEGDLYIGAKYIDGSRSLSDDRKSKIQVKLSEMYVPDSGGYFKLHEWQGAEMQLIKDGQLQGYPPKEIPKEVKLQQVQTDLSISDPPSDQRSNVIEFPTQAAQIRSGRFMETLTAEQRLKLEMLHTMFSLEKVAEMLQPGKLNVDDLFKLTAEKIYEIYGG